MKTKNITPEIMIRFKGAGQTHVYHPKDTIQGIVEINPAGDVSCRSVQIRIGWHTEGRGTRAEGFLYNNLRDDVNSITMMQPFVEEFSFVIPSDPWSYSGHLISVVWEVEVKVDISMGRDMQYSQPFVVQP